MTTNHLLLLGPPGLTVGGEPQRLDRKPLALLAWLALAEGPISRTSLAELLWPDSTQPGVNLRKSLTEIRLAAGAAALAEGAAAPVGPGPSGPGRRGAPRLAGGPRPGPAAPGLGPDRRGRPPPSGAHPRLV
ncbi:MAG: hypothetical protein IPL60_15825 [Ardenticatenia bacterium]|nr:hypothetical protein [Ardenticatenia bacterium]